MPSNLQALETLLARIHRLGGELLSFDGYDRWGAQHDTPEHRAEMESEASRAAKEYEVVVKELNELVRRVRASDPESIARWADLHCELLRAFVATCAADSTNAFVANEEIEGWAAVKRGEKAFVDENVFYVHVDRERYVAAFGIDPTG